MDRRRRHSVRLLLQCNIVQGGEEDERNAPKRPIYPGSINDTDVSSLNYYADRDTVWFRLQYYLL